MFTKLVSQLSLSPSAVSQLTFYGRRLAREGSARRSSAIAAALLIALQSAVILFPPTPSNAASPADIIQGGIISQADLLNRYDENQEVQAIYAALGINRLDLEKTAPATINSSDRALKALGRTAHSADDFELTVGKHTYYMQPLYAWDAPASAGEPHAALEGQRSDNGSYFAILMRSGNPVSRNFPLTPLSRAADLPLTVAAESTPTPSAAPTATPKPGRKTTPTPTPLACVSLSASVTTAAAPFQTSFTAGPAAGVTGYIFDFGDGTKITSAAPTISHTYAKPGKFTATLQLARAAATSAPSPACTVSINSTSTPAAYSKSKSAINITQNVDATTRPAAGGDEIRYHLVTKNIGGTAGSYAVVEHLQDVLEYADITDAGGAIIKDNVLTWPTQTILPTSSLTTEFTVRIKNPIPTTPIGLSDRFSYDLRLDNVYGNAVRINVAPPASKQIEIAAASLPRTSTPVASVIILLVCLLALYFYARNRQLQAEVKILRGEYDGGL